MGKRESVKVQIKNSFLPEVSGSFMHEVSFNHVYFSFSDLIGVAQSGIYDRQK